MKNTMTFAAALMVAIATSGRAQQETERPAPPKTLEERSSYSHGFLTGRNLKAQGMEVDARYYLAGLLDGMNALAGLLDEQEMRAAIMEINQFLYAQQEDGVAEAAAENKKKGEEFLAKNKELPNVVALDSGLQYQILTPGEGASPKITNRVKVHYKGTLIDGTPFDSSYDRGEPATFNLGEMIPGWIEAIPLMKTGAKWKLFIPSDLAYGAISPGDPIGPNATLIFEVELLEVLQ